MYRALNAIPGIALIFSSLLISACSAKIYTAVLPSPVNRTPGWSNVILPSPISDAEIEQHIDPKMLPSERDVIRNVMLRIPNVARENVIYLANDGRLYSNHVALKREIEVLRPAQGQTSGYVDRKGRLIGLPLMLVKPQQQNVAGGRTAYFFPPATAGTGPYRRLYSDSALRYTYASASISPHACPLTPIRNVGPAGDIGYIYSGGWSSSGQDSADAGFQYSAERDAFNLFIKVLSRGPQPIIDDVAWPCKGPHSIHFLVTGGYLLTFATGYDSRGRINSRTLVEAPGNYWDWTSGTQVMKLMVSIAQVSAFTGPSGVAQDGYSFGMSSGEPTIELYNVAWGYCSDNGTCSVPSQVLNPAWFQSVPDAGQVRATRISIGPPNFYTETDGIQLGLR